MIRWQTKTYRILIAAFLCAAFMLSSTSISHAACANPTGTQGEIIYNSAYGVFQGCKADDNWQAFHGAGSGGGGCTNPNGQTGEILYNSSEGVLQGCIGSGWQAFHIAPDPCEIGPFGTMCESDNAVYAGNTVGGVRMYAARCDHGQSWNGSVCSGSRILLALKTTNTPTAGATSGSDGLLNTNAMEAAGLAEHPAAEACRNLGAEWYMPASDELQDLLWENLVDQDADNTPGGPLGSTFDLDVSGTWYTASRASLSGSFANIVRFNDGNTGAGGKTTPAPVRCVRSGGGGGCSNPTSTDGEIIYNTSEDVFQGCTATGWKALH